MKKLNRLKQVAFLAIGLLVPTLAIAESDIDAKQLADLKTAQDTLAPIIGQSGSPAAKADTDAAIQKLKKDIEAKQQELKAKDLDPAELKDNNKVQALTKNIKKFQEILDGLSAVAIQGEKNKQQAIKDLKPQVDALKAAQGEGVKDKDVDTSDYSEVCTEGVNGPLSHLKTAGDSLESEPYAYIGQQLEKLSADDLKKSKENFLDKAIAKVKAESEKRKAKKKKENGSVMDEETQPSFNGQDALGLNYKGAFERQARDERQKDAIAQETKESQDLQDKIDEQMIKLFTDAKKSDESEDAYKQLGTNFFTAINNARKEAYHPAWVANQKQYKNCVALAQQVGAGPNAGANAQTSAIGQAVNAVVAYHFGNYDYFAKKLEVGLYGEVAGMNCKHANTAPLGSDLEAKLKVVTQATDLKSLLQLANDTRKAVSGAAGKVAKSFANPLAACDALAKEKEAIEGLTKRVNGATAEMAQSGSQVGPQQQAANLPPRGGRQQGGRPGSPAANQMASQH